MPKSKEFFAQTDDPADGSVALIFIPDDTFNEG